ncbi:MAG: hypothetical protein JSU65_13720 [Candidatus Zixiibacteriota bacterium]|nr:MAG: hypothetical protein JSU65_13720 [candidate division Zixibacteria bacterium]
MSRRLLSILLAVGLICLPGGLAGMRLKGQAVTWADFNYVHHVSSSISHVYFATTGGLIRYNKVDQSWELPLTGADGMFDEQPRRVWVDWSDDHLFVETDFSLYEYDPTFDRWYPMAELPEIDNTVLHIQTPEDLLPSPQLDFVHDDRVTDSYSRAFAITDILDDQTGNLWIGTWGFGAGQASSSARVMEQLPYGLLQNHVQALHMDNSTLWVGGHMRHSYRTGLTLFYLDENSFAYLESGVQPDFPATDVNCIEVVGDRVYIGTHDGLYVVDAETLTITNRYGRRQGLSDFEILSLEPVGDSLFVGTTHGIDLIEPGDSVRHLYPTQFAGQNIHDLERVDDYLWIASSIGAYRLLLKEARLQKFDDPGNFLFGLAYNIERYNEMLWIATDVGVLGLNLETGATETFRESMRGYGRRALAVNDLIVAMASDRGLTIYFRARKKQFSRTFTTDDGLASNRILALLLDGDYIWVGTDLGLTRFLWNNPDRID